MNSNTSWPRLVSGLSIRSTLDVISSNNSEKWDKSKFNVKPFYKKIVFSKEIFYLRPNNSSRDSRITQHPKANTSSHKNSTKSEPTWDRT